MTGWFLSMQARQLGSSAVCARLERTGLAQVGKGLFSEEEPGQDSFAAGCSIVVHSVAALKCIVINYQQYGFHDGAYSLVRPQTGHAHVWVNIGHLDLN